MSAAMSHPTRDGWIEINEKYLPVRSPRRPIPHGMGGLKCQSLRALRPERQSHPTRDGWIEMSYYQAGDTCASGPIPHGMGGLKYPKWVEFAKLVQVPSHTGWVD